MEQDQPNKTIQTQIRELEQAVAAFESQRAALGDEAINTAVTGLRLRLAGLYSLLEDISSLDHQLQHMETNGLIQVGQLEPELEYLFRHALIQNSAYDSLLKQDRREIHHRVAHSLEALYPHRREELASSLAYHFIEAGIEDQALHYSRIAAEQALTRSANREAEAHFRTALELVGSEEDRAALLHGLGQALERQGRYVEASDTWRDAIELYLAMQDTNHAARLYARMGRAVWQTGDHPASLTVVQEGVSRLEGAPASEGLAALLHEAGRSAHFNALPDAALNYVEQALAMASEVGALEVEADALATWALLPHRPIEQQVAALTRAIELAEEGRWLQVAHRAHNNLAILLTSQFDDLHTARKHAERAAEIARLRGSETEETWLIGNQISSLLHLGELNAAQTLLANLRQRQAAGSQSSIQAILIRFEMLLARFLGDYAAMAQTEAHLPEIQASGDRQNFMAILYWLGDGFLEQGAVDKASAMLARALEIASRSGVVSHAKVLTSTVFAVAEARRGRQAEADSILAAARESAGTAPPPSYQRELAIAEARIAAVRSQWVAALVAHEQALALQERGGYRWQRARTFREMAEVHLARGGDDDLERARKLLHEARTEFEAMNAPIYVRQLSDRLAELDREF